MDSKLPMPNFPKSIPDSQIEVRERLVPLSVIKSEIQKITWASYKQVFTTTLLIGFIFAILTIIVSQIDLWLLKLVNFAVAQPLSQFVQIPATILWILSIFVFVLQVRHHKGASDPSLILSGATEEIRGRWAGFNLSLISASTFILASAAIMWSSLS